MKAVELWRKIEEQRQVTMQSLTSITTIESSNFQRRALASQAKMIQTLAQNGTLRASMLFLIVDGESRRATSPNTVLFGPKY